MKKPELLAPAGSLKHMRFAFAYGADAVYAGQPRYSLRVRENDFNLATLAEGIEIARSQGKKFYVAANIAPHNSKVKTFLDDMAPVIEMRPDALIMSDPGLIMMVRDKWPDMPIHLSVQANAVNYAAVEFWRRQGLERVILSRELSLEEVAEIKEKSPQMELEVFVHGALCIAYSGRCLLSGYINKRDPNQGTCTNACRWKYNAIPATQDDAGNITAQTWEPTQPQSCSSTLGDGGVTSEMFLLQEDGRPDQLMPAFEDEHGTYIMNSKDLRAVQHVERLCRIGVHSLKIEGRTKSHYYVARTTQAYRQAIDDAVAGVPFNMSLMDDLEKLAHRGYTEGFYRRHVHDEYQNYANGTSLSGKQQFVGEVLEYSPENGHALIDVKNKISIGDTVEIMTPSGNMSFIVKKMENKNGQNIDVAPGSGHRIRLPLPENAPSRLDFSLLMRNL
ncbi:tRNA 5-hydroxyuridine modification protein YegQ [Hahella sp. CR1]|uniref:prephenate-dependent tRNA uridine(34) hydroxylase TrhP n=1 Tax=Hahella sp. CR1 TaxID=2992807 RepID=UPI0024420020|nr:tRNA 5-hydroxyuridine modification protein YegQ [Hahella sp. CR1]MDG9667113.1 tRNA 5-hydroxyuridine modification protein YegQ [Hahella sp. CR1]